MIERKNNCAAARRGRGRQSCVRPAVGIWNPSRFRRRGGLHSSVRGVSGDARLGFFFNADQALIRNLPAKVAVLAALLEILFEKDGTAGIGHENARSGQKNIASAILHLHTTTEKGEIAGHPVLSVVTR